MGKLSLILTLSVFSVCAQVTSGRISGVVLDPSGRAVANGAVECEDTAHSVRRQTATDASGTYRCVGLSPAVYTVVVKANGFETARSEPVTVTVHGSAWVDFQLPLAGRREAVAVTATIQPLQAESGERGAVLDRPQIERLPLNRRDFLQLALLAPGVSPPVEDSELSSRGAFAMHANGGREEYNNFLLDGVDNNDPNVNRYVLQPPADAIQEFRISTNSYGAEFGRGGAGQVNVVTRRGANQFHGFAYEYFRNRVLDARNFFDSSEKPRFVRNQFGMGAGGPVIRDKMFFFASADFLRERRGLSRLATVPTAAARTGDLSGLPQVVRDPFTQAPFPGNIIPATRIAPEARNVLALYPLPNLPGFSGNYLPRPVLRDDSSQVHLRSDHRLGERDELTLRYGFGLADLLEPYAEDTDAVPGFGDYVRDPGHNAMVHHQRVFSAHTVNSLRLGFNRFSRSITPENRDVDAGRVLGVNWLPPSPRGNGFPIFTTAGYSRLGDANSLPINRHTNTYQVLEGLSMVRGSHMFKVGADLRHLQLNGTLDLLTRGSLTFSGALSGAGIGDLLLGFPSLSLRAVSDNPQTMRSWAWNFYGQDEWRVRPDLTLTLGVRYEYNTPATDPTNRMTTLDANGKLVTVGTSGTTRSGIHSDLNNFAPRIGFAWSARHHLVVRGGYGFFYDAGMFVVNSAQYFNPPQFNLRLWFPTQTSLLTIANPFPSTGGLAPPPSLNILNSNFPSANMQHWNLTIDRHFRSLGTVNIGYAGSKGTRLVRSRNTNQPRPAPGDVQSRRPNPAYGGIFYVESAANSNFHSLQATLHRPISHGISLWAVYTYSKSIDNTSAFLGAKADKNFPQDSLNYGAERGLSSFDVPQRFTAAGTYALPRASVLTRNTELRGIVTVQSGQPFTPILRFDNSNTGNTGGQFGSDRPNVLRDPRIGDPGPAMWFDTSALRLAPRFQFGSAGRNIVRGPSYASVDLSLSRRFPLSDEVAIVFDAQAFNVANRVNFNLPELYADEPTTFGRIFAARAPRQFQFSLRFVF